MNTTYTIEDLYDAFTELEHRADLAEMERRINTADPGTLPRRRRRAFRSMPVLATVAAVAAVVVGAVWIVPGDSGVSAGSTVTASPGSPTGTLPSSPTGTPPGSPAAPYPTAANPDGPPTTPEELAARLQVILGDERPITVRRRSDLDPGMYIDGTVTVNGVTGTYGVQFFSEPGSGDGTGLMSLGVAATRTSDDGQFEVRMTVGPAWSDETDEAYPDAENPMTQAELDAVVNSDLWW